MKARAAALLCLMAFVLPAAEAPGRPQRPASDPLLQWMDRIAQGMLDRRQAAIGQIDSVAAAERRKQAVREKILRLMGGLPDYRGPLNPRITGRLEHESFTIEKVIYESLPGFFVTANVYRSNQPGRRPGILLQNGHTQEGKAEAQRLAANLALKGFVVLSFDPIGQGEREQSFSRELERSAAGWSTNEHLQAETQSLLIGQGVARYFIWDAIRSLDYLTGRADVDAARIGAVGCSGGGALTTYIGALDRRVKAVASACSSNSFRVMFARPVPKGEFHGEMGLPGFLGAGLDTVDLVELAAPTPWFVLATEEDFFTPDGAKLVYEEARRWYRLYGAEEKVQYFVGPGPHGTPLQTREIIYRWMIRWLKDGDGDARELTVPMHANHELLVTRSGHVDDEPGSRKLHQLILEDFQAKHKPGTTEGLLAELRRLAIPSQGAPPVVQALREDNVAGIRRMRSRWESEPGVEIEGNLYLPAAAEKKPAVLLVADPTTGALAEKVAKLGRVVLEVEVRHSPWGQDNRPFIGDWVTNTRANHLGRNLAAMRAHDILRAVDVLAARGDVDTRSVRAAARGVKGIWLLLAAAADPRIGRAWVDRTPRSLRSALEKPVTTGLFDAVIPGFVLQWDLDDLVRAMGDRRAIRTDPTSWMGRVVDAGPSFQYRFVLGDDTDRAEEQDARYIAELLQ